MVGGMMTDAMGTAMSTPTSHLNDRFCENCGTKIVANSAFCEECGLPIQKQNSCKNCGYILNVRESFARNVEQNGRRKH